ncbi:pyridoxal phosphate-dependent transferase [Lophiotrema nucula]|uniref:Pyridoxal phosphate-dependent transferase n=1 Tax=Lophiotrema nucula TaxID=690887 RepID=A0A6A5Z162_9PLEO|nr:pyridoxal phosphate-dependent transferase [Lophiotrema nucula]
MDSGLSTRITRVLEEASSKTDAPAIPKGYDPTTAIDLSSAQNEAIYKELSEFFKTTIESKLQGKVFAIGNFTEALRAALTSFFNTYFSPIHPVRPEHIVPTAGCRGALEGLLHAVCEDGDSVLVPGPYWFGCESLLKSRSNVNIIVAHPPSYVNHDNYLLPSLQAAYDFSAEKARIKAVVLTNPQNPLSRCYPKQALVECMEFCQEHGLHLIIDEIFGLTNLKGTKDAPPFVSALSLTEPLVASGAVKVDPSRVHVVWSVSKLFGLSGTRIGCLISQQNPQLCKAVSLLTTGHVNSISALYISSLLTWSQLPTLLALNSERLTDSYLLLVDALRQWDVKFVEPTHGILLFAKLAKNARTAEEEQDFFDRLAVHGVRVGPGRLYNGVELDYGWARIQFSVSLNTMRMAIAQISTFLAKQG